MHSPNFKGLADASESICRDFINGADTAPTDPVKVAAVLTNLVVQALAGIGSELASINQKMKANTLLAPTVDELADLVRKELANDLSRAAR